LKVAIVAPSSQPYAVGGAEKFWWGLLEAFRRYTDHEVELLKVPGPEADFRQVVASYRRFSELNLDHFDLVLSTKYPAWMVCHRNHICYLQHPLRGLYDTYPAHMPVQSEAWPPLLEPLEQLLQLAPGWDGRAALFAELERLEAMLSPQDWDANFAFPGPVTRAVVHWLDASALQPGRIKKFLAISHTVAGRRDYFPERAYVQVLHHPSDIEPIAADPVERRRAGRSRYLFTVSRLDAPKRVDLLIAAMALLDADISLLIAGTGPQEPELRRLAAADDRIRFCGRVSDEALQRLYSEALLVPFVPMDEDYGLITLEALQAGKPVLTCTDAGGVTELVEHGVNGWVVEPTAQALADALQAILREPGIVEPMQDACRASVSGINWRDTVKGILSSGLRYDNDGFPEAGKPRHLVVAVSFPVYPASSGGTNRLFHLYRHIAYYTPVTLVTLCSARQPAMNREIAPGLREVRIPKSLQHERLEYELQQQLGASVGDVVAMREIERTPDYLSALYDAALDADLLVASHPYLYPAIRLVWRGPVIYEAHNVEVDLKRAVLGEQPAAAPWLALTREVEARACQDAIAITVCSDEDGERLAQLYQVPQEKLATVPNGVDSDGIPWVSSANRLRVQRRCGSAGGFSALFMGSQHGPNNEAVRFILETLAPAHPDIQFWVVGSAGSAYGGAVPDNVVIYGQLEEGDKNALLSCARMALNPVASGSGSNLKMAEYVAAGLPVLTTPFGCRGLEFSPPARVRQAAIESFSDNLHDFVNEVDRAALKDSVSEDLESARTEHDWRGIAERYYNFLTHSVMKISTLW
jgi:glycosyltransferase involved in cell wall biosynthesis